MKKKIYITPETSQFTVSLQQMIALAVKAQMPKIRRLTQKLMTATSPAARVAPITAGKTK